MVEKIITEIEQGMAYMLNNMQMEELHQVLVHSLYGLTFYKNEKSDINEEKVDCVNIFICAKGVEGCSEKSIKYYKSTIENILNTITKPVKHITFANFVNQVDKLKFEMQKSLEEIENNFN